MFNLSDYEDVATRIKRVLDNYPMVRFNIRELKVDHDKGYCYAVTEIFRDANDPVSAAVDVAYEVRSDRGVNRDFWVENCITSSYGRCAGLLLGTDKRPTKQDMEKAQRLQSKPEKIVIPNPADEWTTFVAEEPKPLSADDIAKQMGGEIIEEIPNCDECGKPMQKREGTKNGKAYFGYVCGFPVGAGPKHPAKWYDLTPSGKWVYKPRN